MTGHRKFAYLDEIPTVTGHREFAGQRRHAREHVLLRSGHVLLHLLRSIIRLEREHQGGLVRTRRGRRSALPLGAQDGEQT